MYGHSYWKSLFPLLIAIVIIFAIPSQALAQDVLVADKTVGVGVNEPDQQQFNANNLTLTNSGTIDPGGARAISNVNANTGITIINNAGATITSTTSATIRSILAGGNDLTITNSGTIQTTASNQAIQVKNDTNFTLTNNAGGVISGVGPAINLVTVGGTINNSGTISTSATNGQAIQASAGTGLTINNNAGGVISGATIAVRVFNNNTIINSGTISSDTQSLSIRGDNNTITLKEGSILVGSIGLNATATTGNILKIDQGFGQSYFYETVGTGQLSLQDLSGNTVVAGSAGSVGQAANESVDELLGLRSFNLRSALKRYTDYSKHFGNNELYVEPFSFYSKRGTNTSVLGYETYGGGLNLIYPLKNKKVDLVLSLGHSEQDIDRDHDISRNNFLAGINARDLGSLGKFNFSGFFVGGMEFHEGSREVYTNTSSTGKADVTSDYTSYEVITGGQVSFDHSNIPKTTWNTELGVTFGYSFTGDYHERQFFAWGERHLVQGSVHVGEQLTTKVNKDLAVRIGVELDYRNVLMGRTQSYAVNGTLVKNKGGDSFTEKTASLRMGMLYGMSKDTIAYVNMDGRISDNATQGTYGLSIGMKLNF